MSENAITLKSLKEKYQNDKNLRRYSDKHYLTVSSIYSKVDSNKHVEQHRDYLVNSLETYNTFTTLGQEEISDIEKAMAKYEIAVRKIIQNIDNPYLNFDYEPTELNNLIIDVFTQQEDVQKLLKRRLFQ